MSKKLGVKLQNQRFLKTSFDSFRHWKATMLYHQNQRLLYRQRFSWTQKRKKTETHITIERTVFGENAKDEYNVKVTEDPKGIKKLLEVGFEYFFQKDTLIFLRKRK